MAIFDLFGKKEGPMEGMLYTIQTELHPFRLYAHKNDYTELEVVLKNVYSSELLTSLVVIVPKGLGFDQSALSQQREVRIGQMKPGEEKHFKIPVWASQRTDKGRYVVRVYAISHYHDYGHVLNEARKELRLRVE
ncbi:hypothetical protein H0O03_04800 [Candidatus Micrarchaeota archaeon]|nr:hypothetical protein [Candidatus Micrarchaeota archaeon]